MRKLSNACDEDGQSGNPVYVLISVCDRDILTEQFPTLECAQSAMRKEMIEWGEFPEDIFDENPVEFSEYDYGYYDMGGFANDAVNHSDCDWRIIEVYPS